MNRSGGSLGAERQQSISVGDPEEQGVKEAGLRETGVVWRAGMSRGRYS